MNLTEFKDGDKVKVLNIPIGRDALSRLTSMNIRIGTKLEVITQQPFYGPVTVKVGNSEQTIGRGLAQKIECEEYNG